jgi:hypothetical protein
MSKPKLNKTYTSFGENPKVNNADQIRRDNDTIKTPKCTIIDIDTAIMTYVQDVIQPQIIENNSVIDVPVFYANGEKWAQFQSRGYMFDDRGRALTPSISIRRNSMTDRDTLKTLGVNQNPAGNDYIYRNKHTLKNRYNRFSVVQGVQPSQEFYVSPVPEFVDVSYDILIWTEYTDQMNSIIEQIMPLNGFAWGTTWKFPTVISDYSFETLNTIGEDRIVRASLPITVKGSLLMPYELRVSNLQKQFSVKRVTFTDENDTTNFNTNISDPPPGGYDR